MRQVFEVVKQRAKYWWTSLIIGALAIVLGFWCIGKPVSALMALTYVFIIAFFIGGIFDMVFAISNRKTYDGWGWTLTGGIVDILFGILLLAMPPHMVTTILVYFIGFWILFRCIWTIGISFELQRYTNTGWLLAIAILGLIFSIIYLISPIFNGVFLVSLVSLAFLFYGVFRIYHAFQLKKLNSKIKDFLD